MLKNAHKHPLILCSAALILLDLIVLTMVDPRTANAVWLIIAYILVGLTVLSLVHSIPAVLKIAYGDRLQSPAKRAAWYSGAVIVIIIGLQSMGQLTVKDIATLLPFAAIAYFYVGYSRQKSPQLADN